MRGETILGERDMHDFLGSAKLPRSWIGATRAVQLHGAEFES